MKTMRQAKAGGGGKRAVIFDLDGTLADTLESLAYCTNRALATEGLGSIEKERFKRFVGDGATVQIERCLRFAGDEGLTKFEAVYREYLEIFARDCMYGVKPYDGIPGLLAELKKRGIRAAVFSNKPHLQAENVVISLFGEGAFDAVRGQQPKVPKKPAPEGVFLLEEELQVPAEAVVYVGDTDTDMRTGRAAGVFTVGALWGFREREELERNGADAVIERPEELLAFLE